MYTPSNAPEDIPFAPSFVDHITEVVFEGLETFVRDANLPQSVLRKYKTGWVIQEKGYMDVSEFEGGPTASARYHVISSDADRFRVGFEMYGALTLPPGCYFKILDVHEEGGHIVITLLHVPLHSVVYFLRHRHQREQDVVQDSRMLFSESLRLAPHPSLDDEYWHRRTAFPIGIADDGSYFFNPDVSSEPEESGGKPRMSLFRKWFAKRCS